MTLMTISTSRNTRCPVAKHRVLEKSVPSLIHPARGWCSGIGLILIGLNLRIGVASIGPVLGDIQASLGLSATIASLLTTIPVFAFVPVSPPC